MYNLESLYYIVEIVAALVIMAAAFGFLIQGVAQIIRREPQKKNVLLLVASAIVGGIAAFFFLKLWSGLPNLWLQEAAAGEFMARAGGILMIFLTMFYLARMKERLLVNLPQEKKGRITICLRHKLCVMSVYIFMISYLISFYMFYGFFVGNELTQMRILWNALGIVDIVTMISMYFFKIQTMTIIGDQVYYGDILAYLEGQKDDLREVSIDEKKQLHTLEFKNKKVTCSIQKR